MLQHRAPQFVGSEKWYFVVVHTVTISSRFANTTKAMSTLKQSACYRPKYVPVCHGGGGFLPHQLVLMRPWINCLCDALVTVLHDMQLTHTDLKPENILFVNSDSELDYDTKTVTQLLFIGITSSKAYITIAIRLRYDCNTTTIRRRWKTDMFVFLVASNWKQARAIRRSRIVVESHLQSRHCCIAISWGLYLLCRSKNTVLFKL